MGTVLEGEMTAREKELIDGMIFIGLSLVNEGRKMNLDPDAINRIAFSLETGYVSVTLCTADGRRIESHRFDQFPDIDYTEYEEKE